MASDPPPPLSDCTGAVRRNAGYTGFDATNAHVRTAAKARQQSYATNFS